MFLLFILLLSFFAIIGNDTQQVPIFPFTIPVSIKTDFLSEPIRIKPDFSSVGAEIGTGIGQAFSEGARSFADSTNSESYGSDLSRGMTGVARNMGNAFHDFNNEAEAGLFPEMARSFRGIVSTGINKRNAFQFGGLIALSFAISATGYYLTKFLWEVLTHKVLNPKPVILLPGTTYGWWDRVKRWWSSYQSPVMIGDAMVSDRLTEIEEKTKKIRSHNRVRKNKRKQLTYDNLLLCGEPGTGKTLFAQVLADRADMDIVITTAASLLQSGVSGVKYFNDIMRMAKRSKYGLIIFIDEADALFVDRDSLSPDSDHYKVLSHILALTGQGSATFMLIAATNHSKVIDSAMGRRFQDRIDMPLPGFDTRVALLKTYIKQEFASEDRVLFSQGKISQIAEQVEGLSHAEIADMVRSLAKRVHEGFCKEKDIDSEVCNAVTKRRKTEEDKAMRDYSLSVWRDHMQKMFTVTT